MNRSQNYTMDLEKEVLRTETHVLHLQITLLCVKGIYSLDFSLLFKLHIFLGAQQSTVIDIAYIWSVALLV